MRHLVTTEALMSGIRATTSAGTGLDRPSMASWTPEHQPAWTSALDADYRVEYGRLAVAAHARSAVLGSCGSCGACHVRRTYRADLLRGSCVADSIVLGSGGLATRAGTRSAARASPESSARPPVRVWPSGSAKARAAALGFGPGVGLHVILGIAVADTDAFAYAVGITLANSGTVAVSLALALALGNVAAVILCVPKTCATWAYALQLAVGLVPRLALSGQATA